MLSLPGCSKPWQKLSYKTRLSSTQYLLQREGSGDISSQFSAGRGVLWSLDLVMPIWTFPFCIPTTFYQKVLSITWALCINKVALYIDDSHERAQQLLWSHHNLLFKGPNFSPQQRSYTQVGLLLLGERPAFASIQEQRCNKTPSLFTVPSPCLQSVVLIVHCKITLGKEVAAHGKQLLSQTKTLNSF